MTPRERIAVLLLVLVAALAFCGCGGVGLTFSVQPTIAAQVDVLGVPLLHTGPRHPRIACYGYQNGYVMAGASSKHVYKRAMG